MTINSVGWGDTALPLILCSMLQKLEPRFTNHCSTVRGEMARKITTLRQSLLKVSRYSGLAVETEEGGCPALGTATERGCPGNCDGERVSGTGNCGGLRVLCTGNHSGERVSGPGNCSREMVSGPGNCDEERVPSPGNCRGRVSGPENCVGERVSYLIRTELYHRTCIEICGRGR